MKKLLKLSYLILLTMLIIGCENNVVKPELVFPSVGSRISTLPKEQVTITTIQPELKFELKRVQSFSDGAAYSGYRDIYILKDNETGKEYIGISGIGITERGSHTQSKNSVQDER